MTALPLHSGGGSVPLAGLRSNKLPIGASIVVLLIRQGLSQDATEGGRACQADHCAGSETQNPNRHASRAGSRRSEPDKDRSLPRRRPQMLALVGPVQASGFVSERWNQSARWPASNRNPGRTESEFADVWVGLMCSAFSSRTPRLRVAAQ
jgi:hypothetical protein